MGTTSKAVRDAERHTICGLEEPVYMHDDIEFAFHGKRISLLTMYKIMLVNIWLSAFALAFSVFGLCFKT
jgi:hypothetical protein